MARRKTTQPKRPIESYEHKDEQRVNNPPVGLVTPETDPDAGQKRTYAYDPRLNSQLQVPGTVLYWAHKKGRTLYESPH